MSDVEEDTKQGVQDVENLKEKSVQVKVLKAISKIGKGTRMEVPSYYNDMNLKKLIDWINELDEYFECKEIDDPKGLGLQTLS